jgi:hypothetical protein
MKVRSLVCFDSSLPEDCFEDDDGRLLQPPGKSVADAIAGMLSSLGFPIDYGPKPRNDHSWDVTVVQARRRFGATVNAADRYYLTLSNDSWTDKMLGRQPAEYLDLLRRFAAALEADPRFFGIEWFVAGNASGPGASSPLENGL